MNRIEDVTNYITECDKEVGEALALELGRQRRNLELIASENIVSPAVMLAMGTVPTNKYAEGYPGKRYYGGCEDVDILENLAIERAKELFGCEHVCVQPHSGANANTAVYQALLEPGDTVMGLNLAHGGHLTHGSTVNLSGISAMDIAKGLLDNGIHPPTMYFPLIVDEALMVEPTETESKETLDNAIAVFRKLYELAGTDPEKARHDIHTSAAVQGVTVEGETCTCHYIEKEKEQEVTAEYVLCAVGRCPNTDGLFGENVKPDMERGRVLMNENFESSIPGVYAIGDLIFGAQLAHAASAQGMVVAEKLAGKEPFIDLSIVPGCVYTDPEIASAGMTEDQAKEKGIAVKCGKFIMSANGKSIITQEERGFIKVVAEEEVNCYLVHQTGYADRNKGFLTFIPVRAAVA